MFQHLLTALLLPTPKTRGSPFETVIGLSDSSSPLTHHSLPHPFCCQSIQWNFQTPGKTSGHKLSLPIYSIKHPLVVPPCGMWWPSLWSPWVERTPSFPALSLLLLCLHQHHHTSPNFSILRIGDLRENTLRTSSHVAPEHSGLGGTSCLFNSCLLLPGKTLTQDNLFLHLEKSPRSRRTNRPEKYQLTPTQGWNQSWNCWSWDWLREARKDLILLE